MSNSFLQSTLSSLRKHFEELQTSQVEAVVVRFIKLQNAIDQSCQASSNQWQLMDPLEHVRESVRPTSFEGGFRWNGVASWSAGARREVGSIFGESKAVERFLQFADHAGSMLPVEFDPTQPIMITLNCIEQESEQEVEWKFREGGRPSSRWILYVLERLIELAAGAFSLEHWENGSTVLRVQFNLAAASIMAIDHWLSVTPGNQSPKPPTPNASKKSKKSAGNGDARAKLIAALSKHHDYASGSCLNTEPIGNNELASSRHADVATGSASAFFEKEFGGHLKYRVMCRDPSALALALKALNDEFTPRDINATRKQVAIEIKQAMARSESELE